MSRRIHLERDFLCFIAHNTNYKQIKAVFKNVDKDQYTVLREISLNVLNKNIELSKDTFDSLKRYRDFIRKLAVGHVSKKKLAENSEIVCELVRLALQHYAICKKAGSGSRRRIQSAERKSESS